jgi:DNA-3-methyladenine glycosylase
MQNRLGKKFYIREVTTVAKELLGKTFVKIVDGETVSAKIVEVEAYYGAIDEAAHSFGGKTKRNKVMFNEGGSLYVYFIYGTHYCCNVVTRLQNDGSAVLIRAVEPLTGIDYLAENRYGKTKLTEKELMGLTNGPGKICKAFNITKKENGIDLSGEEVFLLDAKKVDKSKIVQTVRVGIKKSAELPWRFYLKDNPFVSRI